MELLPRIRIAAVAGICLFITACASGNSIFAGGAKSSPTDIPGLATLPSNYGDDIAVRMAVRTIKSQGSQTQISSRAIRLPERPLSEISSYSYRYPEQCGGHMFTVYDFEDTQILEYHYANGIDDRIRDYVSGPSPFISAGLWTAYDHTSTSVSTMTPSYESHDGKVVNGVYSRGLVSSLPDRELRTLGNAYERALVEVNACQAVSAAR